MKRCPACQRVYESWEVECVDCRVALRESIPEAKSEHAEEASVTGSWQLLRTVGTDLEANIIRGILETAGIPSRIEAESVNHLYGITSGAFGGVRIYVPANVLETAEEILAADIVPDDETE